MLGFCFIFKRRWWSKEDQSSWRRWWLETEEEKQIKKS